MKHGTFKRDGSEKSGKTTDENDLLEQLRFFLTETSLLGAETRDFLSTSGFVTCVWRQLCDDRNYPGIILAHMYGSTSVLSLQAVFLFSYSGASSYGDWENPAVQTKIARMRLFFPSGNLQCRTAMKEPVTEQPVPQTRRTSDRLLQSLPWSSIPLRTDSLPRIWGAH